MTRIAAVLQNITIKPRSRINESDSAPTTAPTTKAQTRGEVGNTKRRNRRREGRISQERLPNALTLIQIHCQ